MPFDRHLDWDGRWNARDLGGLRTIEGRETRRGAVVRSESLDDLSELGWMSLERYGIATIVDLRNPVQRAGRLHSPPVGITTILVPLEEDLDKDPEFRGWMSRGWLATPLYFARFIERWPNRCVRAVAAVAEASSGGVVVHCGKGSDRTGLVVLILLALVGVLPDEIATDYEMTVHRLRSASATRLGLDDDTQLIKAVLERERTSARAALLSTLESCDLNGALRGAGLTDEHEEALHRRLLQA